ncbi:hypothetical protein Taro_053316, partial [Colocasia esculenta]|nr:hypothetical protein [Colocasia esculenta]
PLRHSPYVSGLFRPVKAFLEGERIAYLTVQTRNQFLVSATERITSRYYDLVSELVDTVRKTESSPQRICQTAQRRGGTSTDASDNTMSNTDKLCMQYFLDIQEYGCNLIELGVAAGDIPAYRSLWQCVAPADRQTTIRF